MAEREERAGHALEAYRERRRRRRGEDTYFGSADCLLTHDDGSLETRPSGCAAAWTWWTRRRTPGCRRSWPRWCTTWRARRGWTRRWPTSWCARGWAWRRRPTA